MAHFETNSISSTVGDHVRSLRDVRIFYARFVEEKKNRMKGILRENSAFLAQKDVKDSYLGTRDVSFFAFQPASAEYLL